MTKRVFTALIGIILLLLFIYLGKIWFALPCAVLAGISCYEYFLVIRRLNYAFPAAILSFCVAVLVFSGAFLHLKYIFFGFFILFAGLTVFHLKRSIPWHSFTLAFFGTTYFTAGFVSLVLLRSLGAEYLLFAFVIIWLTDTGAFFSGRLWGKTKLAPQISPNKTVEGALGGFILSFICAAVYCLIFLPQHLPFMLLLALIASFCCQVGDLLESSFKRWAGIKDSGGILPGHGGVLDRFDSAMTAAPFIYIALLMII
jgi:phosphatidate cytidylyltransferase